MKEYIWSLTVDGEEKDWKCVVYDEDIATFEDDAETHRLPIETKAKNVVQIDEAISVYGKKVHFQLENNTPYIKIGGKWTMSDTTMAERQAKMEQIQNTTTIVQIVMGLLMCAISLAVYFTNGDASMASALPSPTNSLHTALQVFSTDKSQGSSMVEKQ